MSAVTFATAQILRVLPRRRIGRALGRLADSSWPMPVGRAIVNLYARVYDVALDECTESTDIGGWSSFDAFFTRELRPGARAIDPRSPGRRQPGGRPHRIHGDHRRRGHVRRQGTPVFGGGARRGPSGGAVVCSEVRVSSCTSHLGTIIASTLRSAATSSASGRCPATTFPSTRSECGTSRICSAATVEWR